MDEQYQKVVKLAGRVAELLEEVDADMGLALHAMAFTTAAVLVGSATSSTVDEEILAADQATFIEYLNSVVEFTKQQVKARTGG